MSVKENSSAVWWEGGLNIDADGAPNAYGPNNSGLDYTANAGHVDGSGWYGDPRRQGWPPSCHRALTIPAQATTSATTALQDPHKAVDDVTRYVDSSTVPYLSIPKNAVADFGLHVGDVGFAYCRTTGRMSPAIVADVGPRGKYGEGSIELARALGLPTSPRHGGAGSGVVCCVFKGTKRGWPRANADVAQQVQDVINELGGVAAYQAIIAPQS
jgi:hypothetical protein